MTEPRGKPLSADKHSYTYVLQCGFQFSIYVTNAPEKFTFFLRLLSSTTTTCFIDKTARYAVQVLPPLQVLTSVMLKQATW
jgi:hypothetical protein